MIERIDSGGVSVIPKNLQRVTPHQFGANRFELAHAKHGKRTGMRLGRRRLSRTRGARTAVAQVLVGKRAEVAIRPLHAQVAIARIQLDGFGCDLCGSEHGRDNITQY